MIDHEAPYANCEKNQVVRAYPRSVTPRLCCHSAMSQTRILAKWLESRFGPGGFHNVAGISAAIVHRYNGRGSPLHGRRCIVLGREAAGPSANKWNFVGGKVSDTGSACTGWPEVAQTLIDETSEELYVELDVSRITDAFALPFGKNGLVSIVVVAHIPGISSRAWSVKRDAYVRENAPWKYREMLEIAHVPIEDMSSGKVPDLSAYVRSALPQVAGHLPIALFG